MNPGDSALGRLLGIAGVASDRPFEAMLEAARHSPDVQAPAAFRAMMHTLEPFRFGLSCGFFHRGGKTGAFWFLNDYGARGTPDTVIKRITTALESEGFSVGRTGSPGEDGEQVVLSNTKGPLQQVCTVERVARFTGTREPRAGGYLIFEVKMQEESRPPTVQQVIDTWPALECLELPAPFKEHLYPLVAAEVSRGGTWTQYYDWTATLVPGARGAGGDLDVLKALAERHGFVLDRDDRGTLTYFHGKHDPPVVFLSIDGGDKAQFRIQPHM